MIKKADIGKYAELTVTIDKCWSATASLSLIMREFDFNTRQRNKLKKSKLLLDDAVSMIEKERGKILENIPGTISE